MTVDLLNHILPLIDDGPTDTDQATEMVKQAAKEGVTVILATPHAGDDRFSFKPKGAAEVGQGLNKLLDQQGLKMKIFVSAVNRINTHLIDKLHEQQLVYADEGKKYLLVELSDRGVSGYADQVMGDLFDAGIIPVLCHPERNQSLMEHSELLNKWAEHGCMLMISASAYTGYYGDDARSASRQLITNGMAYFLGSDAHDASDGPRGNHLGEAYQQLLSEYGEDKAAEFDQNARDLVNGYRIRQHRIKANRKPGSLGLAIKTMLKF
ncbi:tyrosine-protein phosphatase [Limosilactobacillus sp.]|uniref:tyrosine-protein phosphatase n=1 Tax=Limosilactobacillus sp. TaxID=2773925 RepID=UPI00345E4D62